METPPEKTTTTTIPDDDGHAHEAVATDEVLYCTVHPEVETSLRCNRCGRPMCIKCAVKTPVGYRCKECVRGQQDIFFTATNRDYIIAGAVSFFISLVAGYIVPSLGIFFTIILAPVAGGLIAQVVLWATKRRRGRYTGYIVAAGIVAGALPSLWPVLQWLTQGVPLEALVWQLAMPLLYMAVAASVAYSWFRFGR